MLNQRQNGNQNEEDHSLCLRDAVPVLADVIGGVDVQSQKLGGVDLDAVLDDGGSAAGQGHVLVEELEGIGQGQEGADGDGGHHVGDDDPDQALPAVGAVDLGGFQRILRHSLQACDVNDHHIADLLPRDQNHQTPETVGGVCGEVGAVLLQDTVEDQAPDVTQHHAADQVGHEEHGTEQVGAPHLLSQGVGDGKGHHVDQDDGHHGEAGGIPEGMGEAGVLKGLDVVFKTDELGIPGGHEVAQGQVKSLQEGPDEAHAEAHKGGQHQQGEPALDRSADQHTVHRGAVTYFLFQWNLPHFPINHQAYIKATNGSLTQIIIWRFVLLSTPCPPHL